MLLHLSVQNYALIDKLEVDFSKGFTVITGETGAGKSILLGALGLVSGSRADSQSLYDKQKKCIVEAVFDIKQYVLKHFFKEHDLDYETTLTIRREINPEGKSRAFVNDTPVTLNLLKDLSSSLIDIHSQHQTYSFSGSSFQLSIIDTCAGNTQLLAVYTELFTQYKLLEKQLYVLTEREMQAKKDVDYFQFQFDELDQADLILGEQEQLEQELQTLNNAEDIKLSLLKAAQGLNGGEINVLLTIADVKTLLSGISKFKPEIQELCERINSTYIELKDIVNDLESIEQDVVYDPSRIEHINNRLDFIYHLQQKHQLTTVQELIQLKNTLSDKLAEFNSLDVEIETLKNQKETIHKNLFEKATTLSENRKKSIPAIEKNTSNLLRELAMPHAQLKITVDSTEKINENGMDIVKFWFSANKGSELKELDKVASGGEMSRLMLSIKSQIARHSNLPTLIFDEIDTGVSGDVADKMGGLMQKISTNIQVIAITHLPQIAAKGNEHLYIFKEEKNNRTYSNLKRLDSKGRVGEIAKMLSTGTPTPAALKNAEELLKNK